MEQDELVQLNQRIDEIDHELDSLSYNDWQRAMALADELDSILDQKSSMEETLHNDPNTLKFDQSKRSKPLINKVYNHPAKIINLQEFRLKTKVG